MHCQGWFALAGVTGRPKNCNIQPLEVFGCPGLVASMSISTAFVISSFVRSARTARALWALLPTPSAIAAYAMFLQRHSSRRNDVYNILWAVVFGFATLNILSLAARRFEPNRRGLTFGELMAVLVVLLSVFLLGWELLGVVKIFPLQLHR